MVSGVFRLCSRVAFEFYAVLTMLKEFFETNICTKRHCPVSFEVCISYKMLSKFYESNNTTIYSSTLNFVVLNRKWIIPKVS